MTRRASEQALALPELVDLILRQLQDDLTTLKSCTLLGRTWSTFCRSYIFRSLTINVHKGGRSLAEFLALLSSSLTLGRAVRELFLLAPFFVIYTIDAETLHELLSKLPNLRVLSIENLHYGNISTKSLPNLDFKVDVLKLECSKAITHSLATFLEILSLFSEVRELDVQTAPFREVLVNISTAGNIPERIPQIYGIRLSPFSECYAMLLLRDALHLAPGSLKRLSVPFTPAMFPELSAVLARYGSQLQELEMQFPPTARRGKCIAVAFRVDQC